MANKKISILTTEISAFSRRLQDIGADLYVRAFQNHGMAALSIGQFRYLEVIYRETHVTVTMLAEYFKVTKPTVSRVVNALLQKKLINKIPDENDSRIKYLSVTDTAREIYRYREKMYGLMASEIAKILPENKLSELISLFALIERGRQEE
ncbi:MAG: MarR family transcriptional regulator [Spirochaetales bacterium]|nr:MarR family transcriptional regulator [Spirochaetales bacterium]